MSKFIGVLMIYASYLLFRWTSGFEFAVLFGMAQIVVEVMDKK